MAYTEAIITMDAAAMAEAVQVGMTAQGYTTARSPLLDRIDVNVSSRSTFAGGAVSSVTGPVTVGTNNDKTGYSGTSDVVSVAGVVIAGTGTELDPWGPA